MSELMTAVRVPPAVQRRFPDGLKTLVLNADAQPLSSLPLSLWSWRDAIEAVYKDRVDVLDTWEGVSIRSVSKEFPAPKVVLCRDYVPMNHVPPLTRLNCALRDKFACAYCGNRFKLTDLTFDHVVPRCRGGRSTWSNLVMACRRCNSMKGSEPANFSGRKGVVARGNFRPLVEPRAPTAGELYRAGLEFIPREVRQVFGEWLPGGNPAREFTGAELGLKTGWTDNAYWNVELLP